MGTEANSQPLRIIHLDDNPFELERFAEALDPQVLGNFRLESVDSIAKYRDCLRSLPPELVILDIHLDRSEREGVSLVRETRALLPSVVILMCSAMDDVATIRECLQNGADDFLSKRSDKGELNLRLLQSYPLARVKRGTTGPRVADAGGSRPLPAIAGRTLEKIAGRIPLILGSAVSAVHLEGESGTGKEVVAELFAHHLPEATPFIKVNCGAITPTLLESELFGHVKGAFTGAIADKKGLLESASGGWIFLDEVATLSASAQVALLRVLENQELMRVGAVSARPIQVRVLSAANERMEELVRLGKFRKDLWQRLCETEIRLPPLRSRPEEIESLVDHFCRTMPGGPYQITEPALEVLCSVPWRDGNVRELRNCLRAMTELQLNRLLTPLSIPERIWRQVEKNDREVVAADEAVLPPPGPSARECLDPGKVTLSWDPARPPSFEMLSDQLLVEVLRRLAASRPRLSLREAARCIGMSRSTLSGRLKVLLQKNPLAGEELLPFVGAGTRRAAHFAEKI